MRLVTVLNTYIHIYVAKQIGEKPASSPVTIIIWRVCMCVHVEVGTCNRQKCMFFTRGYQVVFELYHILPYSNMWLDL